MSFLFIILSSSLKKSGFLHVYIFSILRNIFCLVIYSFDIRYRLYLLVLLLHACHVLGLCPVLRLFIENVLPIKIRSVIQCILLFRGCPNFHLLSNVSPLSSSLAQLPPNAVTTIIDGLKRLYIEKPKPLEVAYLSFAKCRYSDLSRFVVKFRL